MKLVEEIDDTIEATNDFCAVHTLVRRCFIKKISKCAFVVDFIQLFTTFGSNTILPFSRNLQWWLPSFHVSTTCVDFCPRLSTHGDR